MIDGMVKKKTKDRCEDVPKTVFRRVASANFKKIDRVIADLTKF